MSIFLNISLHGEQTIFSRPYLVRSHLCCNVASVCLSVCLSVCRKCIVAG